MLKRLGIIVRTFWSTLHTHRAPAIKYGKVGLPYTIFDEARQVKQADIVSNKRLGLVLKLIRQQQQNSIQRSKTIPKTRGQKRNCKEAYRQVNPAARSVTEQTAS